MGEHLARLSFVFNVKYSLSYRKSKPPKKKGFVISSVSNLKLPVCSRLSSCKMRTYFRVPPSENIKTNSRLSIQILRHFDEDTNHGIYVMNPVYYL